MRTTNAFSDNDVWATLGTEVTSVPLSIRILDQVLFQELFPIVRKVEVRFVPHLQPLPRLVDGMPRTCCAPGLLVGNSTPAHYRHVAHKSEECLGGVIIVVAKDLFIAVGLLHATCIVPHFALIAIPLDGRLRVVDRVAEAVKMDILVYVSVIQTEK